MRHAIAFGTLLILCCAVASAASKPQAKAHEHCVTGKIVAIDQAAKTFTVHPKTGPDQTFSWGDDKVTCSLNGRRIPCGDLHLEAGDVVTVCQNGHVTIKVKRPAAAAPKTGV